MKRSTKKANRPKDPNNELGGIISKLRFGPALAEVAAYRLKTNSNLQWMFKTFTKLYENLNFRNAVMPNPFPKSVLDVAPSAGLVTPCSYLAEIYWAAATCNQYTEQLNYFVQLKAKFEKCVLLGLHDATRDLLVEAEKKFGFSLWYIQNYLLNIQDASGAEEQKRYAKHFSSALGPKNILAWLIHFISKRSEGNSLKDGLRQETDDFLANYENNPAFVSYFQSKISTHPYINIKDIPGVLYFESRSSLIDLYESLVMVLQTIASDPDVPLEVQKTLTYPILILSKGIQDPRFNNILRGLGHALEVQDSELGELRGRAFDLYTQNRYQEAAHACISILNNNPNDIPIIKILAQSSSQNADVIDLTDNLISEIIRHAIKINEISEDSYYSAYILMTMASKYYNHSWAPQLKMMVHEMLSPVAKELPNDLERALYIHSVNVSPFAALAYRGKAQEMYLSDIERLNWAKSTTIIISKIFQGCMGPAEDSRTQKYYARKLLSDGDVNGAKELFNAIFEKCTAIEQVDAALYLVLCHLALNDAERAVDVTVSVFINQPAVVSRISFTEISELIDNPTTWGSSICVPIFFEIYSTYHQSDKDTHLRFSFERFQEKNKLESPTSLVERLNEFSRERVIYYLDKVCQPNVMRQTLLYDGTKEVENERIRICRALSEIDPKNASTYLDEVRERVKTQQISNGLSIVEQSMVYVDINSITKALKARLKDSYSKYKILAENQRSSDRDFSDLFDALKSTAPVFQNIIIIPAEPDSSGSVFEVMFKEVTNEFLKSDHGLNAFLSTRIRHGKLRNLLRKSVEEENLVTSRKQITDVYQRNEIWDQKLQFLPSGNRTKILDYFDKFSKEFDNKILYILDVLLRVEAEGGLIGERSKAWFQYKSSALEMALIKSDANPSESLDNFIDRCIELLWQKTDANLALARSALTGYLKDDFLKIFDSFSRDILEIAQRDEIQHLLDAIARARSDTQIKLNTAANWFNRSVVYDRPDYAIDMVVNIAVVIINNIRSGLSKDFSEHINLKVDSDSDMAGRTLDGLVDLFGILFENAIDHCELDIKSLYVDVVLEFKDNILRISMINNVAPIVGTPEAQLALINIKETLGKDGARKFLQAEGRSGFHKIWKILNSPYYRAPKLDFSYLGTDKFLVDIEVSLEG